MIDINISVVFITWAFPNEANSPHNVGDEILVTSGHWLYNLHWEIGDIFTEIKIIWGKMFQFI